MTSLETFSIEGSAYGVPVALSVAGGMCDALVERLPPGWTPAAVPPGTRTWSVMVEHEVDTVLSELELHIAEHAPGLIFIHAGVIAVDGRALLLPGRSLAGKSTLTVELVRLGATYYSDEFAVLDENARVLPYPRPLALRPTPTEPGRRIKAEALGKIATEPAAVGLVAHLRHDATCGWSVEHLGSARTSLALIDNAVAAQSRTEEVLSRCAAVAGVATGLGGTRGDAREAAEHLIQLMRN